jgi:phosphoserine phosphatase
MSLVLTLICGSRAGASPAPRLDDSMVARASAALRVAGARLAAPDWLDPPFACDLAFDGLDATAAERSVRAALAPLPVDLAAQPLAGRRKALLVADMDSTILVNETLDELAEEAGLGAAVAEISGRSMRGEVDFAQSLRVRVAMLEGLEAAALARTLSRVQIMSGARALIATMRAHGAHAALVSGGFTAFTRPIAERLGFDEDRANTLEFADGRLSGRMAEPILDANAKLAALTELAAARGIGLAETAAVGDGANDLPMLLAAGLGVAYRGKPMVAAGARFRIEHGDLAALLYFQGYRGGEIVWDQP